MGVKDRAGALEGRNSVEEPLWQSREVKRRAGGGC